LKQTLEEVVSRFGESAKSKLASAVVHGEPEDQLRAPFEQLLDDLAGLCGLPVRSVVAVGETALAEDHTRPDYAVTVGGALAGFVELKAPGKGADPRRFKGHDKAQWLRLQSLPNLLYADGNEFSLWRNGELAAPVVRLVGDIETSGLHLGAAPALLPLFEHFFGWQPIPPRTAKELAEVCARLCRLLRDEVTEALAAKSEALTTLAADWRELLFPQASDEQFADGYAQTVTFGLLMARARGISVSTDLHAVAEELKKTASLIGTALELLTYSPETRQALKTSLLTLERVLDAVDWHTISKGRADAWLYFYEDFLEVYDNDLRKKTGSYYTPPEVVGSMVALVDEALRRPGFGRLRGIADTDVTVADPATGTGTFVLGVLRQVAATVTADEGPGAVPAAIESAMKRLLAFEIQLGPFAVAQLRVYAEAQSLTGVPPTVAPRMFVTDTLGNPNDDGGRFPGFLAPIGKQRKDANRIKREEPITVVIGNPPYKEKAKGRGGWVEGEGRGKGEYAPLDDWQPPAAWRVGPHAKHLRNLYVYFWRWASRKVFEELPDQAGGGTGIVAFITVAGFLSGPGFQRMREYLRQRCHEVWVIDCSPEGHQPEVATRVFQGVQQPVCIVLASRWSRPEKAEPAVVRWRALPQGHRNAKFEALAALRLDAPDWLTCPSEGRAPFLPAGGGAWTSYPTLEDLFVYNGSGVMPGRTWVIAPDADSLQRRWARLVAAPAADKEKLFHPHLADGGLGDRHVAKVATTGLAGYSASKLSVAQEAGPCVQPVRYGYRSFDRQWLIPDARLINRPNPTLWASRSDKQVSLTAFTEESPAGGPALTITSLVPDLHHYKGSFGGRAFPLWADAAATQPNLRPALLAHLSATYGHPVTAEDLFAYIAAVAAHPGYVARFRDDLATPGLRIPLTADAAIFGDAAELGRRVVWLHTFGDRFADATAGRSVGPPRLPPGRRPQVPSGGAIPGTAADMPDVMSYDASAQRLQIGGGRIEPVPPAVWNYEVSGKQVLVQWFSYRKKNRERPIIGDRRTPSPLGDIQPETWLAEYTTELLNVLNVLGLLVDMEPVQAELLQRICAGPLIDDIALRNAGAFAATDALKRKTAKAHAGPDLLTDVPSLGS
jgi:hypothetical protein